MFKNSLTIVANHACRSHITLVDFEIFGGQAQRPVNARVTRLWKVERALVANMVAIYLSDVAIFKKYVVVRGAYNKLTRYDVAHGVLKPADHRGAGHATYIIYYMYIEVTAMY